MIPEDIAKSGSESAHQKALFAWAAVNAVKYPMLQLMHAIPNGGKRDAITAARLKAEGVKSGVPDIFLPYARSGYHGLYIEMKVRGGKISDSQKCFIASLTKNGYNVIICYSWIEAAEYIECYLRGELNV